MMTAIKDRVRSFIVDNFLFGDTSYKLSDSASLIENDIIDSTAVLELVAFIEDNFGIAMVDAGMRELWATGFMHNRARMICASFLVKNLLIHWIHGARWFWDTLVDADLASNSLNWQWIAGTGPDAAPWFRIFNPDTQADKFDPQGEYRRRWLGADGTAGTSPIVDLAASRQRALAASKEL